MKKLILVTVLLAAVSFAVPPKGGIVPCLSTCCLGPRVGLEMNEGTKVKSDEWLGLIGGMLVGVNVSPYMAGYQAFTGESMNEQKVDQRLGGPMIKASAPKATGGCGPALGSFCLGPRVGLEMNDGRGIRTIEWFALVIPLVPQAMMGYEAYSGKTMSEVAAVEGLDK